MITPGPSFRENLSLLPSIEGVERIDLVDTQGAVVHTIENQPGKQGSLAVYQYLHQTFGTLDAEAAAHGLTIFAEHTADAQANPGAHPNIDLLLHTAAGGLALQAIVIPTPV